MKLISIYDADLGWVNKKAEILTALNTGFIYPAVVKIKNGFAAYDAKTGCPLGVVGDKDDVVSTLSKNLPTVTEEKWISSFSTYKEKNPTFLNRPDNAKEYLTDAEIAERLKQAEIDKLERAQISKFKTLVRQNIASGGLYAAELQLKYLKENKEAKVADGFTYSQAIAGYQNAIAEHKELQR